MFSCLFGHDWGFYRVGYGGSFASFEPQYKCPVYRCIKCGEVKYNHQDKYPLDEDDDKIKNYLTR